MSGNSNEPFLSGIFNRGQRSGQLSLQVCFFPFAFRKRADFIEMIPKIFDGFAHRNAIASGILLGFFQEGDASGKVTDHFTHHAHIHCADDAIPPVQCVRTPVFPAPASGQGGAVVEPNFASNCSRQSQLSPSNLHQSHCKPFGLRPGGALGFFIFPIDKVVSSCGAIFIT